jgi:hypothetical protein
MPFSHWWSSLSGESKAAIIAAIVSPIVAAILGVCMRLIRWFYIRTIEKLDAAREQIRKESTLAIRTRLGGPINELSEIPISLETLAKKAGLSMWCVQRAMRWYLRLHKFGPN